MNKKSATKLQRKKICATAPERAEKVRKLMKRRKKIQKVFPSLDAGVMGNCKIRKTEKKWKNAKTKKANKFGHANIDASIQCLFLLNLFPILCIKFVSIELCY